MNKQLTKCLVIFGIILAQLLALTAAEAETKEEKIGENVHLKPKVGAYRGYTTTDLVVFIVAIILFFAGCGVIILILRACCREARPDVGRLMDDA